MVTWQRRAVQHGYWLSTPHHSIAALRQVMCSGDAGRSSCGHERPRAATSGHGAAATRRWESCASARSHVCLAALPRRHHAIRSSRLLGRGGERRGGEKRREERRGEEREAERNTQKANVRLTSAGPATSARLLLLLCVRYSILRRESISKTAAVIHMWGLWQLLRSSTPIRAGVTLNQCLETP